MRVRRSILALVVVLSLAGVSLGPQVETAHAAETWQYHLAQANNFYRNRLYPKALAELKVVVADSEGMKELKAWQLIVQIAGKMKDLDSLIMGLEGGVAQAKGQDAAQMQAQLYRLKRVYGRVIFEVEGGNGKLPDRGLELKLKSDIGDPEIKSYFERGAVLLGNDGYSMGSLWLPSGDYLLDGAPLKIVSGKDTLVEVAPTADVTLGIELGGLGGGRFGEASSGNGGGLGGLQVMVGPHIRFASGLSLVVQGGGLFLSGPQSTVDVQQDAYDNHSSARISGGAGVMVGLEFKVAKVDLGARIGYAVQYIAPGLYFDGVVASAPEGHPAGILRGEFIVPALAHGPRLGFQALIGKAVNERGKRVPRVFVGLQGGPIWATPQWGDLGKDSPVTAEQGIPRDADDGGQTGALGQGSFSFQSTTLDAEGRVSPVVFVDLQAVVGLQFRL